MQTLSEDLHALELSLRAISNDSVAQKQSAYMRNLFSFLGVPTPARRHSTREFLRTYAQADKASIIEAVTHLWDYPEREFQYVATDLLARHIRSKMNLFTHDDVPWLKELVVTHSWWDTVDSLDTVVGALATAQQMLAWSTDENMWVRRVAIDHQLLRKDATDTALLSAIIENNLGSNEFFINKSIGWALRDFSKTDPAWVSKFLATHHFSLAPLSVREASKYL